MLLTLLLLGLTIYAAVDCIQTEESRQRHLPKVLWLLLILLFPVVGPVSGSSPAGPVPPSAVGPATGRPYPRGPDDDPDFLRNL